MSGIINSNMRLLLPQQVSPNCPPEVRPYIEDAYNAIQQLQQYVEQFVGVTPKEPSLWSQLTPADSLLEHQTQRVYVIASETIVFGAAVNLYNNAGVLTARNANATNNTKPCHGFCNIVGGVSSGDYTEVLFLRGLIAGISGLVLGTRYFLSTTSGLIVNTEPNAAGNIGQVCGVALSTDLFYVDVNLQWRQF